MIDVPKHSQAKLEPSELVEIGLLFALKGAIFQQLQLLLNGFKIDVIYSCKQTIYIINIGETQAHRLPGPGGQIKRNCGGVEAGSITR